MSASSTSNTEQTPSLRAMQIGTAAFAPMSARRLLVLAGIGMILAGMIFGDIFAVFVLHQNAARVGSSLAAAANAALAGDPSAVQANFMKTGGFLENRGTKVDTHVHLIGFGYMALLFALAQPWVAFSETARRRLALLLVFGGILLPVNVFLIHYIGLSYSPLQSIGWASIVADTGGFFVLLAALGYLAGIVRYFRTREENNVTDGLLSEPNTAGRRLLAGGVFLILIGFAQGAYYAQADLYRHEAADFNILSQMSSGVAARDAAKVNQALGDYGQLQGDKAVKIAAHAHMIEFGLLAMIVAFFQPYVQLRDVWQRRWAATLLVGSVLLPVCVLMELRFGLLAGGLADTGGLLVIIALFAMWIGILRYTGQLDSARGAQ
jgi:hypothetical protein